MSARPYLRPLGAVSLLLWLFLTSITAFAQTSTSGLLTGVVTDPSGAVIPGVSVALQQTSTNVKTQATTDSVGHYVFPVVDPGDYSVTFSANGFQNAVVPQVHVAVQKAYTVNMAMQVGKSTETVQVTEITGAELQTTSATVGTVLGGDSLENLPTFTRSASSLMFLQPAISPDGMISGARREQVTFTFDGGDVTSDLEGSNSYATPPGEPSPSPVIPIPIESTEEFQVATSNPNATFGRSSGGQVSLVTKRGTNAWHGSVYEYHNDDGLNANGWTNNFNKLHKPHSADNRFGTTIGGPILKDKLWFFANYEGRRLHSPSVFNAIVPTSTLQSGVLQFKDAAGNVNRYSFMPGSITTACGGVSCDPRSLGASPVILSQLALYPNSGSLPSNAALNKSLGDGFNTIGYTFTAPTPINQDLGVIRLDYKFTDKWNTNATYHYARTARVSPNQLSILGTPGSVSTDPIFPQYYTLEVTGQLTPNVTAVTHGSFLRDWWGWNRIAPTPLVSGTQTALALAGEGAGRTNSTAKLFTDPININTQQARGRVFNGKKFFIGEDLNWVHGSHLLQFGGAWYTNHDYFMKTDNFAGGLTAGPELFVESKDNNSGVYLSIPSQYRPATCGGGVSANCLQSSDVLRWNELYATLLGLVDRSSQVITRNGNFVPNPVGTPAFSQPTIDSYNAYVQDIWKLRPSLTVTAGLNWGVQPNPTEAHGKYDVLVYASSGQPVDYWNYFQQRAASLNGGVAPGAAFNPLFGVTPVNSLPGDWKGKLRVTNWHQFAPRLAAAWEVPFKNWLFGDNKTVIRGGYAMVWDRMSDINQVSLPLTTGGLLDANACGGPVLQAGSVVCTNAGTTPVNAFRIGPDGSNVAVPAPTTEPIPYVPSGTAAAPFGLFMMSGLDPFAIPAHDHTFDLTVQRELPGHMVLELGYIGRLSRNLPQDTAYNATDYLMKDAASGQTYAQAFDAVAQALRGGAAAAAVPVQPFFENQIGTARCTGPLASKVKGGVTSCTQLIAALGATNLINGSINLLSLNQLNQLTATPIDNIQSFQSYAITDHGYSDYHAGFVGLNKSFSNSLQFQANWTWSHAIGNQGVDQQNGTSANSPYNLNLDKASETFDRRHVVNFWWYYELPFGRDMNGWMRRVIGGWNWSGIYTFATGTPLHINADGDYGAYEGQPAQGGTTGTAAICPGNIRSLEGQHTGVAGSSGIGTGASGINLFGDPASVYNSCSRPLLSVNNRVPLDSLRALPRWNVDFSVGKNFPVTERVKVNFSAELLNAFNLVNFNNPTLDLNNKANFGVFNSQANNPRRVLLGLKVVF